MFFGSIATCSIGVASKNISVNAGQASVLDTVAELMISLANPPIPANRMSLYRAVLIV